MIRFLSSFIILAMPLIANSTEGNLVRVDRYTLVNPKAMFLHADPLATHVALSFPPAVDTVGSAVRYVLLNSGWVLTEPSATDEALSITLSRPLPLVHRQLALMSVRDVLQVLVGPHYQPVEDPIRRIYSFDLKTEYKGLVKQ